MATWSFADRRYAKRSEPWPDEMTTLEAAQDSLQKWSDLKNCLEDMQENIKETGEEFDLPYVDGDTCALCEKFYRTSSEQHCGLCPLEIMTGADDCRFTPYYRYRAAANSGIIDLAREAADDFVTLLQRLVNKLESGEPLI